MNLGFNNAESDFYRLMQKRRSIRAFSRKPVARQILIDAIATAGTAPSGANAQPWFFALIESEEMKLKIRKAAELVENEFYSSDHTETWRKDIAHLGTNADKPYLSEAPALIAVFSKRPNFTDKSKPRFYYPLESTGIAVGFLIAALQQAGLASLTHTPQPMHFLNELLKLGPEWRPFVLMVTGYPKEPVQVPLIKRKQINEISAVY